VLRSTQGAYQFGVFELNLDLHILMRDGQRVPIGPKAFEVLTCLVENADRVVTKSEIIQTVWPDAFVEEGTLTQHIFSLRKALGADSELVVTVSGTGYRFQGPVRHVRPDVSVPRPAKGATDFLVEVHERTRVVVEEPVPSLAAPERTSPGTWLWIAGVAAVAMLAMVGIWLRMRRPVPRDHVRW
jgi:DNA-binding winged helix-turn-helix (wHTH) protein